MAARVRVPRSVAGLALQGGMRSEDRLTQRVRATAGDGELAEIVARIKHLIIFGRLKPRERLIEDELCARFQASRHVVRAAFVTLEHLGLVTRRPNKGAIVRDFSVEEVEEIYEMRAMLQAEAARRIQLPLAAPILEQLAAIHAAHGAAIARQDLGAVCTLNNDFHRAIFAACGNRYLASTIERLWTESLAIRCYAIGDPVLLARSQREHARILAALRKSDRETLVREVVDHIWPALHAYKRAHGGWDARDTVVRPFERSLPRTAPPELGSGRRTTHRGVGR
jgi:DNA-binding GntR family transcriptional regulator